MPPRVVELGVERVGQVERRRAPAASRSRSRGVVADAVEGELAVVGRPRLAARAAGSAARGRRGRRSAGRAGPGRRRARCRGRARRSGQPRAASASIGPLASCSTLGRSGRPATPASAASSSGVELGRVDPGAAVPSAVASASAGARRRCRDRQRALDRDADRRARRARARPSQPADLARRRAGAVEVEAGLVDLRLVGLEGLEEPVAQHPELQGVEDLVHLLAVPRPHREVGRRAAAARGRGPAR